MHRLMLVLRRRHALLSRRIDVCMIMPGVQRYLGWSAETSLL